MTTKEMRLAALERLVQHLEQQLNALNRASDHYSSIRMWLVLIGLPVIWGAFFLLKFWLGIAAAVLLVFVFSGVVRGHRQINTSRQRHALWIRIKRQHIARITLDWDHIPQPSVSTAPDSHPFALDLDLIGPRSIHHLLDTTTTREGSRRLLGWLLSTDPDPAVIARRQALVRELIPLTRFRDRLTLAARYADSGLSAQWSGEKLLSQLEDSPAPEALRLTLAVLSILSALNLILIGLDAAHILPPLWVITLLAYSAITVLRRDLVGDLFDDTLALSDALRRLRAVLGYLETYPYGSHEVLRALCAPLFEARPSAFLRRVSRIASAASLQANFFLWLPVNILVPWDMFFAYRLNCHRRDLALHLPAWLDVWYELEALGALANFAYLDPEYTFPDVAAAPGQVAFTGQGMGHPLIPYRAKVCNDFAITQRGEAVIITGSNMSGKSSFLRTVGVNMALAYAGSTVNAASLRLTVFRLFTSIRVTDSVIDGISYFYAEVKRLRALLDAVDAPDERPLFFLIDEIFRGTNNRERLIGSRAYLTSLIRRGGTGLVATHDLELVSLADGIPRIRNYHFRETVVDGRMLFDYTLRPGPCPTTNALVIMRMEGLPVE